MDWWTADGLCLILYTAVTSFTDLDLLNAFQRDCAIMGTRKSHLNN